MRIGILTWFSAYNYGARAQAHALLHVLCEMGYQCEFINFEPKGFKKYSRKGNLNCWYPYRRWIKALRCYIRCYKYEKDLRNVPCSKKVEDAAQIDDLGYDLLVIGSDSILNMNHEMFHPVYYGVGIKRTPYIFYAPSCESMMESELLSPLLKEGIYNAKAISVRDSNSKKIIEKNTGICAEVLLDPTFLYEYTAEKQFKYRDYILLYSFSNWGRYSGEIRRYAKENKLKIISLGRYCPWADISLDMCSVRQWIQAYNEAQIVVTDSFHGTVFAIKNRKQLVVLARDDKKTKIREMLKTCGVLHNTFYEGGNLQQYLKENRINYNEVYQVLDVLKKDSLNYLKTNIEKAWETT